MFGGYGTGAPCAGCDLAIHPTDVEHELVFADGLAYAFHLACVNHWRELESAAAGGEWRVTCSCKERIGYAATVAEAEALGREHVALTAHLVRFERFPGCGHGVPPDAPDRAMAVIRDFIVH